MTNGCFQLLQGLKIVWLPPKLPLCDMDTKEVMFTKQPWAF